MMIMFICPCIFASIHRGLNKGYIRFTSTRILFRTFACITDFIMIEDATKFKNPSNQERHHTNLNILKFFTGLCTVLWMVKGVISVVDPERGRDLEQISDGMSLVTLLIGEIPKTGFHLFFVCKHAHRYNRYFIGVIIFLSIYKLAERIWGIRMQYDWRTGAYPEVYTICYILGVIIKLLLSLALTVVQIKRA